MFLKCFHGFYIVPVSFSWIFVLKTRNACRLQNNHVVAETEATRSLRFNSFLRFFFFIFIIKHWSGLFLGDHTSYLSFCHPRPRPITYIGRSAVRYIPHGYFNLPHPCSAPIRAYIYRRMKALKMNHNF